MSSCRTLERSYGLPECTLLLSALGGWLESKGSSRRARAPVGRQFSGESIHGRIHVVLDSNDRSS